MKLTFTILICLTLIKYLGAGTIYEGAVLALSLPGSSFVRYQSLIVSAFILASLLLGARLTSKPSRIAFTILVTALSISIPVVVPRAIVNQWAVAVGEIEGRSLATEYKLQEMVNVPYFTLLSNEGQNVIVSRNHDPLVIEEIKRSLSDHFK